MLERQADQQLAELVQVGRLVELGADRQLALALLTLTGLPFIATRHDSHLAGLRVDAREEGIFCRAVGLPGRIPLRSFDWTAPSADLATPTLILHGALDDSVPIRLSQALRDARSDLIELEAFDADHTLPWNTDPDRWQATVASWLLARISR